MPEVVQRGYDPTDERDFHKQLETLGKAGEDVYYLINHGYPVKSATEFVGNHYLLSERQRLALARSISAESSILARKAKELSNLVEGSTVYIDGFNTIISLEIAFSGSTLLLCMDGTVRDLAGLRGTYRLIDKTDMAIRAVRHVLERERVGEAHFLLDAPVSNSGRLKARIAELMEGSPVQVSFSVIPDVDKALYTKETVVTGDAIILDHCKSWFNLVRRAIELEIGDYPYIEIMKQIQEDGNQYE